jgi:hypothetical protein
MAIAGIRSLLSEDVTDGRFAIGARIVMMDMGSHVLSRL